MRSVQNSVGFWATILGAAGTVVSFLGLIRSRDVVAVVWGALLLASAYTFFWAVRMRRLLRNASIVIDGRSIGCLNLANLARRRNQTLVIQRVKHEIRISRTEMENLWTYSGYCRVEGGASVIEFSVDSEAYVPFDELECFAFDLKRDPIMKHKIFPKLLGPDGLSKKIEVPFARALKVNDQFSIFLYCRLPNSVAGGDDFYASTLSFKQPTVPDYEVELRFKTHLPDWVRVYECDEEGRSRLVEDLPCTEQGAGLAVYRDVLRDVPGESTRIYMFYRNF